MNLNKQLHDFLQLPLEDFKPHITLLRKPVLKSNFKDSKEVFKTIQKITISIDNISLIQSTQTKEGYKHTLLQKTDLK